jgi:hypothetical protein
VTLDVSCSVDGSTQREPDDPYGQGNRPTPSKLPNAYTSHLHCFNCFRSGAKLPSYKYDFLMVLFLFVEECRARLRNASCSTEQTADV